MVIILGGTGHVGSATAETLLRQGEAVTVVTRSAERAERLRSLGAEIAFVSASALKALDELWRIEERPDAAPFDLGCAEESADRGRCADDAHVGVQQGDSFSK